MAETKEKEINPPSPKKRSVRIGRLYTVGQVASELARIYRASRKGNLPVADASRLANVLAVLKSCLEAGLIEARLEALEKKTAEPSNIVQLRRSA